MKWRDPAMMWEEALAMLDRADRLHRQFFRIEHQHTQGPTWTPPVDVFETETEIVIVAALPGITAEQLAIAIDGGMVSIRGQRAMRVPRETAMVRRLEIPYGQFERRIELPPGRYQPRQRLLKDGCLILTLSKLSKPR